MTMKDRRPLFRGPSDIDWLVADHARSEGLPRTFLPDGDEDPGLRHELEALSARVSSDPDVAIAMNAAASTINAALLVLRAFRALVRPLLPERPVVVRLTESADEKDVSEAA